MKRKIIKIDDNKCNGCGLCADACAEGAIKIVDGKAKLVKDEYCDGLGACIGECPEDAIEIIEREAADFDEKAVEERTKSRVKSQESKEEHCSCPSSEPSNWETPATSPQSPATLSNLSNWPIQLKLVPIKADFLNNAAILLSADCAPFADADFHNKFLDNKKLIIGCPKLDDADFYIEKLSDILKNNDIKGITVIHMEVPCCSGLINIAKEAIKNSGKDIPVETIEVKIK